MIREQEIKINRLAFDNELLLSRVLSSERTIGETRIPRSHDIELNYNTKANYVNLLEERLANLTEMMRGQGGVGAADEPRLNDSGMKDLEF